MATTLTYDAINKGWVSFYSYEPEWMAYVGNQFFTFKDGNIYEHDVDSVDRTNFYGTSYGMHVEFVSNEAPSEIKLYKAMALETNSDGWYAELDSEMEAGVIGDQTTQKFVDKEGFRYAYIRREASATLNFNELSILGIGNLVSKTTDNFTFSVNIPNQVNARSGGGDGADQLYHLNGSTPTLVGSIDSVSGQTITVTSTTNEPSVNDFCFVSKDDTVESYGLRGYHSKIKLTNKATSFVELFAANLEAIKSYT